MGYVPKETETFSVTITRDVVQRSPGYVYNPMLVILCGQYSPSTTIKIPAWSSIHAHEQDFAMSDELLLPVLKAFVPQQVNRQTIGFDVFTCGPTWYF
jgi:hypothetical protein